MVILMGDQALLATSISLPLDSLSMHSMKRYGEMGSLCLIPLEGLKDLNFSPLTKMEIKLLLI